MPKSTGILRQLESYPESRLPPAVRRLIRPQPCRRVVELAFLRWEKKDLMETECFRRYFGMHVVGASPDPFTVHGPATAPCIAVAEHAWSRKAPRQSRIPIMPKKARATGRRRLGPVRSPHIAFDVMMIITSQKCRAPDLAAPGKIRETP